MTFEDMMKMRRLGDTAVSPDGKWLAYSVTTVNLAQNTKPTTLWIQAMSAGEPKPLSATLPGDSGPQFSADGKRILFLSSREGGQQVWLADFDPDAGTASHPKKLTSISTEADNALWSPDGKSIVFTSAVYPDCPAMTESDAVAGNKCNADRDATAVASKVKARVFTRLLYRHWDHFTGDKRNHLFLVSVETGAVRDLMPNDPHDVPPFSIGGNGGFAFAPDSKELAFTENLDEEPAISTNADIFTLDLTDAAAKPVKVSTSLGGDFSPAYSPDGKYLAWRSQARPGYESDKFRLMVYERAAKTTQDLLPKFENWVDEFAWGLGSHHIYFTSGIQGEASIYRIDVRGGDAVRLTHGAEFSDLRVVPVKLDRPSWEKADGLIATRMKVDRPAEVVYPLGHHICAPQGLPGYDANCDSRATRDHAPERRTAGRTRPAGDGVVLVYGGGQDQSPGIPDPAASLRSRKEIPCEIPHPWGTARRLGRWLELSLEPRVVRGQRLCRRDGQSAGVDRLRTDVCGWRERRLGRQALQRSDAGP